MTEADPVVTVPLAQWTAIEKRLAELDALAARLAELEQAVGITPTAPPETATTVAPGTVGIAAATEPSPPGHEVRRSRRDVLRGAGVAAAGAVAGGAALALTQADPAAATSGSPLVVGQVNTAANTTALAVSGLSGAGAYGFGVVDVSLGAFPRTGTLAGHTQGHVSSGVLGYDNSGGGATGVLGDSDHGTGVFGIGGFAGLQGTSDRFGLVLSAPVAGSFGPQGSAPPSRSDGHFTGEFHCDENYDLWLCVATGVPGTWRRIAGPATAGALCVLPTPTRCYDSRPNPPAGGGTKGTLVGGSQRTIDTKNHGTGVPAGATAVLVNVTVTNTSPAGYLALYSNALSNWPGTSTVNWDHAGQSIANAAVVAVDPSAQIKAYANTNTDVLIDVVGYYQ